MTLNPTAVASNPRYRGAKPRERETRERELEIERTKQGRKRGDYGGRGETHRTYEEERIERGRERDRERKRKLETTPSRESTVPEINTPASCDHSSCHAPLLSPHISCLSHSLSFIPFSPSLSLSLSLLLSSSLALSVSRLPFSHPPHAAIFIPLVAPLIVAVAVIWRPIVAPNTNGAKGRELSEGRRREGNLKREKA